MGSEVGASAVAACQAYGACIGVGAIGVLPQPSRTSPAASEERVCVAHRRLAIRTPTGRPTTPSCAITALRSAMGGAGGAACQSSVAMRHGVSPCGPSSRIGSSGRSLRCASLRSGVNVAKVASPSPAADSVSSIGVSQSPASAVRRCASASCAMAWSAGWLAPSTTTSTAHSDERMPNRMGACMGAAWSMARSCQWRPSSSGNGVPISRVNAAWAGVNARRCASSGDGVSPVSIASRREVSGGAWQRSPHFEFDIDALLQQNVDALAQCIAML